MQIPIIVPDGVSGSWRVETFIVSDDDAKFNNLRALFHPDDYIVPGTYKRLMRGSTVVMSNTPMEIDTNRPILRSAFGRVLINGLGLGMVLTSILAKSSVTEVWVIEQSADVITLVAPTFASDPRVHIVHADALTWQPPKGLTFDAVWHDIWDTICADNLDEMKHLHRKYGRKSHWQGSWARDRCEQNR